VWLRRKVIVGDVRERQQRQKPRYYNEAVAQEIVKLWQLLNYACGERLVAIIPELQCGEARIATQRRAPRAEVEFTSANQNNRINR